MKAVYAAVFLDSPERLLSLASDMTFFHADGSGQDWTDYADHMTIQYLPKIDALRDLPIGKIVDLRVSEFVYNTSCVAARIDLSDCVELRNDMDNSHPHVTIATAPGVPPVHSNSLLEGTGDTPVVRLSEKDWPWYVGPQTVRGRVGIMCEDKRIRFDLYGITCLHD
jgi:hypothetical protein